MALNVPYSEHPSQELPENSFDAVEAVIRFQSVEPGFPRPYVIVSLDTRFRCVYAPPPSKLDSRLILPIRAKISERISAAIEVLKQSFDKSESPESEAIQ